MKYLVIMVILLYIALDQLRTKHNPPDVRLKPGEWRQVIKGLLLLFYLSYAASVAIVHLLNL
jgi:hypothetical protein